MAATNRPAKGRDASTDDADGAAADAPALLAHLAPGSPPRAVRALAFWFAVLVPFLHVPLLATGLETGGEWYAFLTLLVLNAACLYVGHGYATR